jgi:hypothetical protein
MKIDGACHCGAIAFEAEVDPGKVVVCHCIDCQILSGAPFRASIPIKAENLRFTRGAPKHYVKTAQSGNKRAMGFCAECGTPFYSTSTDAHPSVYMMRLGSIRQRDQLIPTVQIWRPSAQPWAYHVADLPAHDGNLPVSPVR